MTSNDLIRAVLNKTQGRLGFPAVKTGKTIPQVLIGFNELMSTSTDKLKDAHVHFFIDDYQFERLWNFPERYIRRLKAVRGVVGPDFSLYVDGSPALNIWNAFRNRVLTAWLQDQGIDVIPCVVFGGPESWDYCFEGLPKHATLAVGSFGSLKDPIYFIRGFEEMMRRLEPEKIVLYGKLPAELDKFGDKIYHLEPFCDRRWKKNKEV